MSGLFPLQVKYNLLVIFVKREYIMVFHTFTFFVFFVAFLAFYLPNRRNAAGIWILLIFSNIFYGWWNWKFLGLLWITIIVDYTLSKLIWKTESLNKRKIFLGISILTNLSILAFFKYYNFFYRKCNHYRYLCSGRMASFRHCTSCRDFVLYISVDILYIRCLSPKP